MSQCRSEIQTHTYSSLPSGVDKTSCCQIYCTSIVLWVMLVLLLSEPVIDTKMERKVQSGNKSAMKKDLLVF